MTQTLQTYEKKVAPLEVTAAFSEEKKNLIKRTYCKDCTDDEFSLFVSVCQHTGLDPTLKQIYAIKRKSKDGHGTMSIQTSIDGLRLIADRSGRYCPGKESIFNYDKDNRLFSATSFVKKRTKDGLWHEVSATAIFNEYKPKYASDFWDSKPHLMLAKCAESLALKKAFPAELSGLYSDEEMHQAEVQIFNQNGTILAQKEIENKSKIAPEMVRDLENILDQCSEEYKKDLLNFLKVQGIEILNQMPQELYEKVMKRSLVALQENLKDKLQTPKGEQVSV